MKPEKDIYIKDEGDEFSTVIFQSPKARAIALKHGFEDMFNYKIDVDNMQLYKILAWAVTHRLTVDSEVSIIIPSNN